MSRKICSCLFLLLLDIVSKRGKEQNEIFNTSAVCSTLVLQEELTDNQGGTDAGGSNTENNRPCD